MESIAAQYAGILVLVCVGLIFAIAWLLQERVKERIYTRRVLEYRKAAGRLLHRKPFTSDREALQALEEIYDFDVNMLHEITKELGSEGMDLVAKVRGAKGYRDIHDAWMFYIRNTMTSAERAEFRAKIIDTQLDYEISAADILRGELKTSAQLEEKMLQTINNYVDAGRLLTSKR